VTRQWDRLSDAYRKRLAGAGITKSQYESGAPLTAARGHRQTPEHPSAANKQPEKYAGYRSRKAQKTIRESVADRAKAYYDRPASKRTGGNWPKDETTEFWREYQELIKQ
jgi:hypothetical protein